MTMTSPVTQMSYTAFEGHRRLASGAPHEVALAVRRAYDSDATCAVLIYDDLTGQQVDMDLRGTDADIAARLRPASAAGEPGADSVSTKPASQACGPNAPAPHAPIPSAARGRGRPKLGVVSREVTLLPRHWEWLTQQPGGASVALRKLVDQARHADDGATVQRQRHEAAYRFMASIAGNLPGFEEAARALFAHDPAQFMQRTAAWPHDVREYAADMAFGATPH